MICLDMEIKNLEHDSGKNMGEYNVALDWVTEQGGSVNIVESRPSTLRTCDSSNLPEGSGPIAGTCPQTSGDR